MCSPLTFQYFLITILSEKYLSSLDLAFFIVRDVCVYDRLVIEFLNLYELCLVAFFLHPLGFVLF